MPAFISVLLALIIGAASVVYFKGDNPVEEAADAVINAELGTNIDISDMMEEPKK